MGEGRRRREFPEAFERQAVERVRTSGMTLIAVAKELGLHEAPWTALDPEVQGGLDRSSRRPGSGRLRWR